MQHKSYNRRSFLKTAALTCSGLSLSWFGCAQNKNGKRPNILLAISDDQSWPHTTMSGCKFVNTPAFDRIAREGVLFTNGFCPAPQCSPARAGLLTGRNIWQNEEAGTHASYFPSKFKAYTEILESTGYLTGYTGKPWGPGNWEDTGRKQNPAGNDFNQKKLNPPTTGISDIDYAANFEAFLRSRSDGQPFCFWYGGKEPHRAYEKGSGLSSGKNPDNITVPKFLPDHEECRSDLADYGLEIEWFDKHLGRMIQILEETGELDNTIIVVTGDNGMPFPRAKANLYEYGTHVPLAIRWGDRVRENRKVNDFVSFIDLAPTFLEAAGLTPVPEMTGRSLMNVLTSDKSGRVDSTRDRVFTGRERHTHARPDNLGYPCRAIRTDDYLYIRNFKPERWPAGDLYHDVDGSPTKDIIINNKEDKDIAGLFEYSFGMRPTEELYAVQKDPECLNNLANDPQFAKTKQTLWKELETVLREQKDPRVLGYGDIFDSYPRFRRMRNFKGFKERGKYNPEYQKKAKSAMKKLGIGE